MIQKVSENQKFVAFSYPAISSFKDHCQLTKSAKIVYIHFKSCDQSFDKSSFDMSSIFRAMQSRAMKANIA